LGGNVLETVGRYKVQEKIGEGAMADVYRAYDPSINRTLAIKVLKNEFLQDEEYAGRFLREAKAAGALSHPNIVTIFDVGEVSGHPFIVMELLDGKPLDKLMSERQKLTLDETMNIGMQLARALDYAHAQGIIHRDIKPSNIMISSDGQSVKILDYGIARLNENDALLGQEVLKTQVGAVLGTPRYMSPEQAMGQTSDGRSDLYSVGIVLYELLTGKKAFSSGSMATLMLQITQQDPEPITKLAPEVPGGLAFIINKLLSKKPEKRFQKGAELFAALKRELAASDALKAEKTKPRSMPLPIKVTLLTSIFILAVLSAAIWAALNKQNKVMQQMAVTSGSAISGFVANNIGTNMLSEDWDQVSVFVKVAAEDKTVEDMVVVDNNNIIRGSKDSSLEGRIYKPGNGPVISQVNNVTVVESQNRTGNRVFQFRQPVVYAQGTYGKVYISLKQNAFEAAAALSRNVLLGLGLVTLLSVILVAYTIAALLAKPIKRLSEAFADAAIGNLDFRISHNRKDEFGELFDGFNRMAGAVQSRIDTAEGFIGDATSLGSSRTALNLTGTMTAGAALISTAAIESTPFGRPAEATALPTADDRNQIQQPDTAEVTETENPLDDRDDEMPVYSSVTEPPNAAGVEKTGVDQDVPVVNAVATDDAEIEAEIESDVEKAVVLDYQEDLPTIAVKIQETHAQPVIKNIEADSQAQTDEQEMAAAAVIESNNPLNDDSMVSIAYMPVEKMPASDPDARIAAIFADPPTIKTTLQPVEAEIDYDRTVIHRPVPLQSATTPVVNSLLTETDDNVPDDDVTGKFPAVPSMPEDEAVDADKTLIRPPSAR
jgi:eukaryotic-like serine/threonine-protein kinase